ncbi:hypothetical protein PAXRUDRAFT_30748 [Paxillus rubicundulus Ve08.2h10]|uniref:Uncharacterized protein n=1 Tax=Paxillus rubicundulus Ve08.2h10 TaxID=930991 RepID=A0A0D0E926_9AGAM|nr:hypothetical protein PAXRUDRAFT_30748 [Paxillus rubicundulus Ve08.2h10]
MSSVMIAPNEEREMTRNQRGLVETCFEEGQYESGISVLEHLRSASFKPPAAHIRQLLYIALFPPPPPTGDQISEHDQVPISPVKGSPTKQKQTLPKLSLSPSVAASEAAQRLLMSFLSTNSPESLFRTLPGYPPNSAVGTPEPRSDDHDEDSVIAQESFCIKDCRDCWAILKGGFIPRKKLLPLARDGGRKRSRNAYEIEDVSLQNGVPAQPSIIAEHAWPVLDWLLFLFEKDELLASQNSAAKFSPLLLSQIPPPRGGTGPRWEVDAPLDIFFYCVQQEDRQRREMSTRLLTLLVNLSLTPDFDLQMFTAAVTTRLYSSSPQVVRTLMESLPKAVPVLTFKVALCQKFLSTTPSTSGVIKPRPKPLTRRAPPGDSEATSSTTKANAAQTGSNTAAVKSSLATGSEVLQLLTSGHESRRKAQAPSLILLMKYALFLSYAHLQRLLPPDERDGDWGDILASGKLKHVIDTVFPSDSEYHTALTVICSLWPGGRREG